MRNVKWSKELLKLILFIGIGIAFFILGFVIFPNKYYSSALVGISAASTGLILFQLKRVICFAKDPNSYEREQIDVKDERNNMILTNAKASSYSIETFVIFGISAYAIYLNNVKFVFAIFILWVSHIFSFFYYLYKYNKKF